MDIILFINAFMVNMGYVYEESGNFLAEDKCLH